MRRAERRRSDQEGRTPRTLTEIDYLMMVDDEARQGALRFAAWRRRSSMKISRPRWHFVHRREGWSGGVGGCGDAPRGLCREPREMAQKKGLPYQTYMKMLLHQALEKERRAS
jgi:hypothetical protein